MAKTLLPVRTLKFGILLTDVLGIWISFNLAFWLRMGELSSTLLINASLYVATISLLATIYIFDLYNPQSQIAGMRAPGLFWIATAVAGGFLTFLIYIFAEPVTAQHGRGIYFGGLLLFAIYGSISRFLIGRWVRSRGQRVRWLVVGDESYIKPFRADIANSPVEGQFTFLVRPSNEDLSSQPSNTSTAFTEGTWADPSPSLREPWTGIVVACDGRLPDAMLEALIQARIKGVRLYDLADFYQQVWLKVPVFYLDQLWLALTHGFTLLHNQMGLRVKRLGDLFGALLLLPIALPIVFIAGILVFLEGGCPIVFRQIRTGKDGKDFTLYKLRTMRKDAEKDGAQWAQKNDSRITFFGKIFRKTRIDELPQLFNVLKGEMSFIGPRPERPEFNSKLEKQIPHYNLRHVVRPGITGWAQVSYPYGASIEDSREKLQYELYYIKNYSLLMDISIIFKTIRLVLFGRGR